MDQTPQAAQTQTPQQDWPAHALYPRLPDFIVTVQLNVRAKDKAAAENLVQVLYEDASNDQVKPYELELEPGEGYTGEVPGSFRVQTEAEWRSDPIY